MVAMSYAIQHPNPRHSTVSARDKERSRHGVAAVDPQIGASDVARGLGQQEGDGAHEVFGLAHVALGDEGDPLPLEVGVFIEDLLGPVLKEELFR